MGLFFFFLFFAHLMGGLELIFDISLCKTCMICMDYVVHIVLDCNDFFFGEYFCGMDSSSSPPSYPPFLMLWWDILTNPQIQISGCLLGSKRFLWPWHPIRPHKSRFLTLLFFSFLSFFLIPSFIYFWLFVLTYPIFILYTMNKFFRLRKLSVINCTKKCWISYQ